MSNKLVLTFYLLQRILSRLKSILSFVDEQKLSEDMPEFISYNALVKVEQQLHDCSVYICVVGRYNAGKTTVINALLGNE